MSEASTLAVVLEAPERLALAPVTLVAAGSDDVLVDVEWSGISTGTERLLWSGRMPPFPGLGYPLVPGYETIGRIAEAAGPARERIGQRVFVPGSRGFADVRGLFGGAAQRLVVPAAKAVAVDEALGENAVLLALAATARHAVIGGELPDLVVGHGVLGRLVARIAKALGGDPVVWENNPARRTGAEGDSAIDPGTDDRRDYRTICDVSGDPGILDSLIGRLAPGGEVVLAGFYETSLSFAFPPAFMREARIRIAAEWKPADMEAVIALVAAGRLSLEGLITHRAAAEDAPDAYRTAFADPGCLKMILDWRARA